MCTKEKYDQQMFDSNWFAYHFYLENTGSEVSFNKYVLYCLYCGPFARSEDWKERWKCH